MKRKKILVIGGSSFLAGRFIERYSQDYNIVSSSRSDASFLTIELNNYKPGCIAFCDLDLDYILFFASPTRFTDFLDGKIPECGLYKGTEHLLNDLAKTSARLIYVSSSAVFNDYSLIKTESHPALPTTEYGRYKLFCEELALDLTSNSRIIRLTKVLDPDIGILKQFINSLEQRKVIFPFSDLFISPVTSAFVTESIERCMCNESAQRMFHCSGNGTVSYLSLAQRLFEMDQLIHASSCVHSPIIFNPIMPQLSSSLGVFYIQELAEVIGELSQLIQNNKLK